MTTITRPHRPRRDTTPVEWTGAKRRYDLVKEFVIAFVVVTLLTVLLSVLFSSPDESSVTFKAWADRAPADFLTTAVAELDGTSDTAQYGPPYNSASDGQAIGPVHLAKLAGVTIPVDTANDFVLAPLRAVPALAPVVNAYTNAPPALQKRWTTAYTNALAKVRFTPGGTPVLPLGAYGPVAPMMATMLAEARGGSLDGLLVSDGSFYQADYTKPLLFLADGGYLADVADHWHLHGDQWGMMNETGSYPGQTWLWLYTLWYQVKPFSTSGNADALVWVVMAVLTAAFVLVPFIPGVRSIPRWIPIYRLIWRDHYRSRAAGRPPAPDA